MPPSSLSSARRRGPRSRGRRRSRRRRQDHPRPEGPQRRPRQEVRRPDRHPRRRHRRQGHRARGPVREHGRPASEGSRHQDERRRRRRHHHRDRPRPGDRQRGPAERRRRRQPDAAQARPRQGRARPSSTSSRAMAIPVQGKEDIAHIATISAADAEIGNLIAEVMDKVGKDGVITVEESKGLRFETEYVEGMQLDRGYISAYFVTNPDRDGSRARRALHPDHRQEDLGDRGHPAGPREGPAGHQELHDHRRGRRGRGPRDPRRQQAARHDQLPRDQGPRLRRPPQGHARGHRDPHRWPGHLRGDRPQARLRHRPADLGRARRVVSNKDETTIIEGRGTEPTIQGRIKQIKAQIDETTSDYDREKLQERLAKLAGGVGVIKVGAGTETELKEKKHRVEDALSATRAAVEEGIVPGGGVALINAAVRAGRDRAHRRRGDRRPRSCAAPSRSPCASSPRTPAWKAPSSSPSVRRAQAEKNDKKHRLRRAHRRVRQHGRRRASSTRPRSPARRSRTPSRSPG